jgi:hypothetical protein
MKYKEENSTISWKILNGLQNKQESSGHEREKTYQKQKYTIQDKNRNPFL